MKKQCVIQKKTEIYALLYYGLLFIFLTLVCVKAPLISDDFEFADLALTNPRELLSYVLYYGNGRLMGNLTGVFFVNFPLLCAVFKAATFCGLLYLLPRITSTSTQNRHLMAALGSLLILGANPDIMGQVFTWTSGWANFVPPILIGLLCFHIIRSRNHFSLGYACLIAVLGFLGQLYVEHASAIQLLAAVCLLFHYRKQEAKVQSRYTLCWFIAGICGIALMFLIPKIFFLEINRTTGYRVFHFNDLSSYAYYATLFTLSTFERCTSLLAVFSVFGFLSNRGNSPKSILKKAIYILVPIYLGIYPYLNTSAIILSISTHGPALLYFSVLVIDILQINDKQKKHLICWLFAMALISLAPFLVIQPYGERCIYLAYILFCIIALILVESRFSIRTRLLPYVCHAATIVVCIILAVSMIKIHHYDKIRDAHIRKQIAEGQSTVAVFELPSKYSFQTFLLNRYYYNEEHGDVTFEIIDLDEWMQIYYQNP